jgi:branched-subunit amino acid ABC-type transport system permease component
MLLLLQLIVNGVIVGALYALITLGFAVIYNGTRLFHLAHGAVFAAGAYALWTFHALLGWDLILSFIPAVVCAAALGVSMELFVYRRLRRIQSSSEAIVIASLGLIITAEALFGLIFGTDNLTLRSGALPTYRIGSVLITQLHVVVALVAVVIFPILHYFISYTRYGRAIRALADDPNLAPLFGIDTNRLYLVIFALGSGLAAIAGGLLALDIGARPDMGFQIMFIALTAVIVGGVGYLPGAAAGGLLIGILQNVELWPLSSRWQNVVVFGALVVFLLLRPEGVFGHMLMTRRA